MDLVISKKTKLLVGKKELNAKLILLSRPEKGNALSLEMLEKISLLLKNNKQDALVFSGLGNTFCSGLDLNQLNPEKKPNLNLISSLSSVFLQILKLQIPSIVFTNGPAIGGGVGLTACFDYVICSKDSYFFTPTGKLEKFAAIVMPVVNRKLLNFRLGHRYDCSSAIKIGLADKILEEKNFNLLEKNLIKMPETYLNLYERIKHRTLDIRQIESKNKNILNSLESACNDKTKKGS